MIKTIDFTKLSDKQSTVFKQVLDEAAQSPWLGGVKDDVASRPKVVVILKDESPIGFHCPRKQSWDGVNYWRAGVLFLTKTAQGKGYMKEVLTEFFSDHSPGLAWIDDKNVKSLNLFEGMGFRRSKAKAGADGEPGHWWINNQKPRLEVESFRIAPPIYTNW